jgi:hypothetical protein
VPISSYALSGCSHPQVTWTIVLHTEPRKPSAVCPCRQFKVSTGASSKAVLMVSSWWWTTARTETVPVQAPWGWCGTLSWTGGNCPLVRRPAGASSRTYMHTYIPRTAASCPVPAVLACLCLDAATHWRPGRTGDLGRPPVIFSVSVCLSGGHSSGKGMTFMRLDAAGRICFIRESPEHFVKLTGAALPALGIAAPIFSRLAPMLSPAPGGRAPSTAAGAPSGRQSQAQRPGSRM